MAYAQTGNDDQSVVLEEPEHYNPSQEEIEEYAVVSLGADLAQHRHLLYIAREALTAKLPGAWKACISREDDNSVYYFNFETAESKWDHPLDGKYKRMFENAKVGRQARSTEAAKHRRQNTSLLELSLAAAPPRSESLSSTTSSSPTVASNSSSSSSSSSSATLPRSTFEKERECEQEQLAMQTRALENLAMFLGFSQPSSSSRAASLNFLFKRVDPSQLPALGANFESNATDGNDDDEMCAICMCPTGSEGVAALAACGHRFCLGCLEGWVDSYGSHKSTPCPCCRTPIRQDKIVPVGSYSSLGRHMTAVVLGVDPQILLCQTPTARSRSRSRSKPTIAGAAARGGGGRGGGAAAAGAAADGETTSAPSLRKRKTTATRSNKQLCGIVEAAYDAMKTAAKGTEDEVMRHYRRRVAKHKVQEQAKQPTQQVNRNKSKRATLSPRGPAIRREAWSGSNPAATPTPTPTPTLGSRSTTATIPRSAGVVLPVQSPHAAKTKLQTVASPPTPSPKLPAEQREETGKGVPLKVPLFCQKKLGAIRA